MDISQQHTPLRERAVPRASTKGSCVAKDEEEDIKTDTSYRCSYLLDILLNSWQLGECMSHLRRSLPCHFEMILLEWLSEKLDRQMSRFQCLYQSLDLWGRQLVHLLCSLHISYRPFLESLGYIVIISLNII